jgi:hypothetical protein
MNLIFIYISLITLCILGILGLFKVLNNISEDSKNGILYKMYKNGDISTDVYIKYTKEQ